MGPQMRAKDGFYLSPILDCRRRVLTWSCFSYWTAWQIRNIPRFFTYSVLWSDGSYHCGFTTTYVVQEWQKVHRRNGRKPQEGRAEPLVTAAPAMATQGILSNRAGLARQRGPQGRLSLNRHQISNQQPSLISSRDVFTKLTLIQD